MVLKLLFCVVFGALPQMLVQQASGCTGAFHFSFLFSFSLFFFLFSLFKFQNSIESKTSERLVPFEWGQSDHSICWDSESSTIYFISDRSGSGQIWQVSTTGSSFQRLTNFPVSVQEMLIDPTSKVCWSLTFFSFLWWVISTDILIWQWVAFSAKVIPTFSMEDTAILMEQYQTGFFFSILLLFNLPSSHVFHKDTSQNMEI